MRYSNYGYLLVICMTVGFEDDEFPTSTTYKVSDY